MSETFDTNPPRLLKNSTSYNIGGKIYFGVVNGDPVNNVGDRIAIFSDRGLSVALPNPVITGSDGRPEVSGTTVKVHVGSRYSMFEHNNADVEQYQDLDRGETPGAGPPIKLTNVLGANAITAEASPAIAAYIDGQIYIFKKSNGQNTANVTLNIDSKGVKPVKLDSNAQIGLGFFQDQQEIQLMFNSAGDHFTWVNSGRGISLLTDVAGTANAITAVGGPSTTDYIDKQIYIFRAAIANTSAVTLKVGTLAAIPLKKQVNEDLLADEILANQDVIASYNSSANIFIIVSQLANQFTIRSKMCIPFFGLATSIPAGYLVCDGNNGTPNLISRFVKGTLATGAGFGTLGGSTTTGGHNLTEAQNGQHTHTYTQPDASSNTLDGGDQSAVRGRTASVATGTSGTGAAHDHPNLDPLNTTLLWIMKV